MSRVPLRPAAGPVDPYERKEIRPPTVDTRLQEIAGALSRFSPTLQQFSADQIERDRLSGESEAEAKFLELSKQYENMDAFRAAVDSGKIHRFDNPWTGVFLKQMVVRDQVRQAGKALQDRFQSDPQFRELGESEIESQVFETMDKILQGASPFALRGAMPEVLRARDQMVSAATEYRRNKMDRESATLFNREIQRALSEVARSSALAAPTTPEATAAGVASNLQRTVDAALVSGLDPEKVRSFVVNSVMEFAQVSGLPGFAEAALKGIQIDGVSADQGSETDLLKLEQAIDRKLYSDMVDAHQREQFFEKQLTESAIKAYLENPDAEVDLDSLPHDAKEFILGRIEQNRRIAEAAAEAETEAAKEELFVLGLSGIADGDPERISYSEMALLSLGTEGFSAYEKLQSFKRSLEMDRFPEVSDTTTLLQMNVAMASDALDVSKKLALLEQTADRLSKADYLSMQSLLKSTSVNPPDQYKGRAVYQGYINTLGSNMLRAKLIETEQYRPATLGMPAVGEDQLDSLRALLQRDINDILDQLSAYPTLSEEEFKTNADRMLDNLFTSKYGLPTMEEFSKKTKAAANLMGKPLEDFNDDQKRAAVAGEMLHVRWDDQKKKTVLSQTGEPAGFPLEPSGKLLVANLQTHLSRLGLNGDEEGNEAKIKSFLIEQGRLLIRTDPFALSDIHSYLQKVDPDYMPMSAEAFEFVKQSRTMLLNRYPEPRFISR